MSYTNQGGMMSDEGFEYYAIEFLTINSKNYLDELPANVDSDALKFIKTISDFRYKDEISAAVLTDTLEELGYIKFLRREDKSRYHGLTQKGIDFVHKVSENRRS